MQDILTTSSTSAHTAGQPLSSGSKFTKSFLTPWKSRGPNYGANMHLMRRIIAEDAEWSLAIVPLLTDLCIRHIVKNFRSESVPARSRRGKPGAGWMGTAWRRGLGGWVLGSPSPPTQSPHPHSALPFDPCSQDSASCCPHFQAPLDSYPQHAPHAYALSSPFPLSPTKPSPNLSDLLLQKALPS